MYITSTFSLKLPSQMERTYNKTLICRSMAHFQYTNTIIFQFLCKPIKRWQIVFSDRCSLTKFDKNAHTVICNEHLALLTFFLSTTAESPKMESLFPVRICTSCQPSNPRSTVHELPIKVTQYEVVQKWENIEKKILGHETGFLW